MEITPQLFTARVMHKRLAPKVNQFTYGVYYTAMPVTELDRATHDNIIPTNRFGIHSLHTEDHGARDGTSLEPWIRKTLGQYKLNDVTKNIMLISMPRVLGYVFNPVSFWLCLDDTNQLRAVLCEVNNTFGETHSYLCAHTDHRPITKDDTLTAQKLFHVSPFLQREGSYDFRFALNDKKLGIWIDHLNPDSNKRLLTALSGTLEPLTKKTLRRAFWRHPLVTLKTITLIHWQAIKLVTKKGIHYIPKPAQQAVKISTTKNLTKM